jgi:electron transport complex protein RnfG
MILVLGCISLVASAGVGYVYKITKEPIAMAVEAGKKAALGEVLPAFDAVTPSEMELDGIPVIVNTATGADGRTVGYAVETATRSGFSGEFKLMVGFTPEGAVRAVKVLSHAETPGLGDKMAGDGKSQKSLLKMLFPRLEVKSKGNPLFASFEGRKPSDMKLAVKKDGGDVDALTAATITSRAYVDAVARAFNAIVQQTGGQTVDAATGATAQAVPGDLIDAPVGEEVEIIEGKEAENE